MNLPRELPYMRVTIFQELFGAGPASYMFLIGGKKHLSVFMSTYIHNKITHSYD